MEATIDIEEMKNIIKQTIKESVKEVMEVEMMKLRAELLNYISDEEQKDIEKIYGEPENKVEKSVEVEL